jgi:hypothetical protein
MPVERVPAHSLQSGDKFTDACGDIAGLTVTGVDVVTRGVAVGFINDSGSLGGAMFEHDATFEVER